MRLSEKLKQIYTSGDVFTVLQLLQELIKAVKEFEDEWLNRGLFQHKLKFGDKECVVVNTSSEAIESTEDIDDIYGATADVIASVSSDTITKIV